MNSDLLKLMIEKQNEWRKQYYADKTNKQIIRTICNRKYKSKGNKGLEEIHKSLSETGVLEEIILSQKESGELCYDSLYGK